jgi:hypothetical protein
MPEKSLIENIPIVGSALSLFGAATLYLAKRAVKKTDEQIVTNTKAISENMAANTKALSKHKDKTVEVVGDIYNHINDEIKGTVPRKEYEKVVEMTDNRLGRMEACQDDISKHLSELATNLGILTKRHKVPREG